MAILPELRVKADALAARNPIVERGIPEARLESTPRTEPS